MLAQHLSIKALNISQLILHEPLQNLFQTKGNLMTKPVYREVRRQLTNRDFKILNYLWKWKILSSQAIARKFFPGVTIETAHLRLRQLEEVKFIESVQIEKKKYAWQLNKRGYNHIRQFMSEDIHHGYRAEYPYHDYLTTAFHLGEWLDRELDSEIIYTEQELRCNPDEFYPEWIPQSILHRPDGYSRIIKDDKQTLFAFEVELSLKAKNRYENLVYFYEREPRINHTLWLVATTGMLSSIKRIFERYSASRFSKHNFILLEDYLKTGWQTPIREGNLAGKTLQDILCHCGITTPTPWHHERFTDSLLDLKRTPSKPSTSEKSEILENTNRVYQP